MSNTNASKEGFVEFFLDEVEGFVQFSSGTWRFRGYDVSKTGGVKKPCAWWGTHGAVCTILSSEP